MWKWSVEAEVEEIEESLKEVQALAKITQDEEPVVDDADDESKI